MNDQERFVREFHRRRAGVTAAAYGRSRSYAVIVRAVGGAQGRLADLGCGDGHLLAELRAAGFAGAMVGLDLSEAELAAARARGTGATLVQARAQALPVRDGAFDVVVSHLAFTLMSDVDDVVRELARVIAPGGRFITLVGGGPRGDDAFAGFLELARPLVRGVPRLGDLRARSDRGLATLFTADAGWRELAIDDVPIDLSGTPDEVWQTMAGAYELAGVSDAERVSLHRSFTSAAARWRRDDGAVACTMATRLVQVTRSG
ncbi:MAG TPA: class I SAM-dependent methyltransferase [Kofleriaceae bacterium]|nr:class I SAM-dependent methyltransferase [Kofleriaceae bacterium]